MGIFKRTWGALRRHGRSVRERTPGSVWCLTALFIGLGVWWSIVTPIGKPPDEPAHVDLVMAVAESGRYPSYDGRTMSVASVFSIRYPTFTKDREGQLLLRPEEAPPRSIRPTYSELGGGEPARWPSPVDGVERPKPNQMPQHGPLYYSIAGATLRFERFVSGGELMLGREVMTLRLLGVAMVAHLPLAAYWAARRLGADERASLASAVVPLCVPLLGHVTAAVSYTPLFVGLSAIAAVLVAGIVRGDRRRSTAVATGGVIGVALWVTAMAVLLVPWVVIAYGSRLRRGRDPGHLKASAIPAAVACGTAVVVGGWWWMLNLIRFGTPTPSTDSDAYEAMTPPDGFDPDPSRLLELAWEWLPARFFGAFGTVFGVQMGGRFVTLLLAVSALGAAAAIVPRRLGRDDGLTAARVVVFGAPLVLFLAFVLYRSWDLYSTSGWITFLQGRYLYGAFVPFTVVLGIGWARAVGRWAAPGLLALAVIVEIEAGRSVLDAWWADPSSSLRTKIGGVSRWNPWFDRFPHLVLLVIAVLLVVVAGALARSLWSPPLRERGPAVSSRP